MRRRITRPTLWHAAMAAGLMALLASLGVRAQQGGGTAGPAMVPLTAASLALHPELYLGQTVSLTATVDTILTKTAFSVDQDRAKPSAKGVLVLAPAMSGTLKPNTYVTVIGVVVRFDPADVSKRLKGYTLDLDAAAIEKYRGQPAVLATGVIDDAMIDIAKKPIVPPTPAEAAFDEVMKQVSAASALLRTNVDASAAQPTSEQAAKLKLLFAETQTFFKTRGTADATDWAASATKLVDTIEKGAALLKWDDVKAAQASLNQLCTQCHAAHRERQDDGTYRVKG